MLRSQVLLLLMLWQLPHSVWAQTCQELFSSNFSNVRITEKAQKHIFEGEYNFDRTAQMHRLKGGLHTWQGLQKFLAKNSRITPLDHNTSGLHQLWYH